MCPGGALEEDLSGSKCHDDVYNPEVIAMRSANEEGATPRVCGGRESGLNRSSTATEARAERANPAHPARRMRRKTVTREDLRRTRRPTTSLEGCGYTRSWNDF
ncbi:hypothetical protein NDU88_006828 [Pleurodeles waltl]|uniref:Uncharacterized protein n=1 Tax=Pleurodeles waltl TaxID=8319 RepID=A0AAV7QIZ5_PLEWA|nr:hypothetical protein NDU88_006828 [Pleurodeles waltl]